MAGNESSTVPTSADDDSSDHCFNDPLVWNKDEGMLVMVGKILAEKESSRAAVETIVRKAWNLQTGLDVTAVAKNAFLFKFDEEEEFNRILRGRPWSINGQMLNLLEWKKFMVIEECDFSRCPIWIQLHGVPLEAICLANAISMGSKIGNVVMAEDPKYNNRMLRSFVRVRIVLDLRKPLVSGFWITKPDGEQAWISVRYEKLQDFCYKCGLVGHNFRTCVHPRLMAIKNPGLPRYGNWITTEQVKTWEESVVVIREGWKEVNERWRRMKEEGRVRRSSEQIDSNDIFAIEFVRKSNSRRINNERSWREDKELKNKKEEFEEVALNEESLNFEAEHTSPVKVNITDAGPSGLKSNNVDIVVEETDPTVAAECGYRVDLPSEEEPDNQALVVFNGRNIVKATEEVTESFCNLKLKRDAEEALEASIQKKQRIDSEQSEILNPISLYAENLRKTKARVRRNAKMKSQLALVKQGNEGGGKRRGRKRIIAEGMGGWPLTAPMEP